MKKFYKHGSEGHLNAFTRPGGQIVHLANGEQYMNDVEEHIVQWNGREDFDSGYYEAKFASYDEAMEFAIETTTRR